MGALLLRFLASFGFLFVRFSNLQRVHYLEESSRDLDMAQETHMDKRTNIQEYLRLSSTLGNSTREKPTSLFISTVAPKSVNS